MKKLRVFLATTALASAFIVASPTPASANCWGAVDACEAFCQSGAGNKYFNQLCQIW